MVGGNLNSFSPKTKEASILFLRQHWINNSISISRLDIPARVMTIFYIQISETNGSRAKKMVFICDKLLFRSSDQNCAK